MEGLVVVCNGGYRTGSTVIYNICKLLFEYNEKTNCRIDFGWLDLLKSDLIQNVPTDNYVVKTHVWFPKEIKEHVKLIYSYRNPFDTVASMCFMHWNPDGPLVYKYESDEHMAKAVSWNIRRQINEAVDTKEKGVALMIPYDDIIDLKSAIKDIALHLNLEATPQIIEKISNDLNIEKIKRQVDTMGEKVLSGTQFRKCHISDQSRGASGGFLMLEENLQDIVIKEFGEYDKWDLNAEKIHVIKPFEIN
jgi:hypothetical protein